MGDTTTAIKRFKLDRFSPIEEDLRLLKIETSALQHKTGEMIETKTIGLFQHGIELYLYAFVPLPGVHLVDLVINKSKYEAQLLEKLGSIHKYLIPTEIRAGLYQISEYGFVDGNLKRYTFTVREEHVFGVLNGQYYYDSRRYHKTKLSGELFHEIIDLTTIKDKIEDWVGRTLRLKDISNLKSKRVKLYFVCFNLFDGRLNKYFVPEDIVEMKVGYEEDRYVFVKNKHLVTIKQLTLPFNPETDGQHFISKRLQTIDKERTKIQTGEKSDWNILANFFTYREYAYSTIYKISTNPNLNVKGVEKFSYAMTLGPKNGYRESKETLTRMTLKEKFLSFDVDQTTLRNISVFEVTYQERGQKFSIPVSSLVYESDKKAALPRLKNRIKRFLKGLWKAVVAPIRFVASIPVGIYWVVRWIVRHWKWILALIIVGLILYAGLWIYLTFFRNQ